MPTACDMHVHSGYSTYDGSGSPESVVSRAVELGWAGVVLTEHGNMMSAPALYQAAIKAKIKPILGIELYVAPEWALSDGDQELTKQTRHLTVLALSRQGYQNLVTWSTESFKRPNFYSKPRISLERMAETAVHGLHHNVVLSGCLGGELCQCLVHDNGISRVAAELYVHSAKNLFPNFYIELQNHEMNKFMQIEEFERYHNMVRDEEIVRNQLLDLAKKIDVPVIITNDSHFQTQEQRKSHIAMLAQKSNGRNRQTSESFTVDYIYWGSYMRSMEKIASTLPAWAEKESIQSIHDIVEEADIVLEPLTKFSYTLPKSSHDDPVAEIRNRSKSRLKEIVKRHGEKGRERFEYELDAMKDFAHYLLIYSDIVRMARSQGIYTWTRGSAANSLVNFCLGVHEIDPIHYNLAFERFVNPARAKFPDVDIDIEAHRQKDVVKMITEYMAETEGDGNVMPICTYSTTSNRNAFRMMAEAAGVPKEKIDELAKLLPQMIDTGMAGSEEEAYEYLRDELGLDIHANAAQVFDSIGSVSQHACAFVLGTHKRPLKRWVPQYLIASSNTSVTQYNMKWIEAMGFLKLDLLRLDTLSIMHSVARQLGKDITWLDEIAQTSPGVYDMPDKKTYKMLRSAKTDGIHSMQGGSQRRGCVEVEVDSDRDLVAVQALYRPSGTRTGGDKKYAARKKKTEKWKSINEFVGRYLDETYGIVIFQEQIMEMGFGMGMSGAEVDDLYKAIKTAKGTGRGAAELFEGFEPVFRRYAEKIMPHNEASELWLEWEKCQGYTFNRGHATSYAILALKTAWIKAHHPQEFYVALLDRYPDNPRYLAAALADGFRFEPPLVNTSAGGFSRGNDDKSIRVGLLRIAGLGPGAVGEITRNQPFASLDDLKERTNGQRVKKTTIEALAAVGALEDFGIEASDDDNEQYNLLKCLLTTPKALEDIELELPKRRNGAWKFTGIQHGCDFTDGKTFCAKTFWIPRDTTFVTKTSPNGNYNAHILTAVDENGIPFDIRCGEDKEFESDLIKLLAQSGRGLSVCLDGQVRMPFERGMNTGFVLWGVSGAEDGNPQCWDFDEKVAKKIIKLAMKKKNERRAR